VEAAPAAEAPAAAEPDPSDAAPAKPSATAVAEPAAAKPVARKVSRPVSKRGTRRTSVVRRPAQQLAPIPFAALSFDPQEWLSDNPGSPTGEAAVAIAQHYLGVPYLWGGSLPATGFDCSGLMMFVYDQLGIQLPHYAASQFAMFPKLKPTELRPGDLVFFEPKFDGPGHVALYVGGDRILEAPHTGALVRFSSFSRAASALGFLGAVRPYGAMAQQQFVVGYSIYESPFIHAE
jgi:cell wall-associated NlpC family hydrolase